MVRGGPPFLFGADMRAKRYGIITGTIPNHGLLGKRATGRAAMDSIRHLTASILRRESDHIARIATELTLGDESEAAAAGALGQPQGLRSVLPEGVTADEAGAMLQDSYRRLGQVVAFSLGVEEPEIIADHMRGMAGLRKEPLVSMGGPGLLPALLQCYLQATTEVLSPDQQALVQSAVASAIAAYGTDKGRPDETAFEQDTP